MSLQLQKFGDFKPTSYDTPSEIQKGSESDWLVLPFGRNRDSDALQESNFIVTERWLAELEEEGESWQIHRFGHWGNGWFEIFIFNPECSIISDKVSQIIEQWRDYVILDENEYYTLLAEYEDESEEESEGLSAILESAVDNIPEDDLEKLNKSLNNILKIFRNIEGGE